MAIIALIRERSVISAPSLSTWIPREIETEGRGSKVEEEPEEWVGVEEDEKLESYEYQK